MRYFATELLEKKCWKHLLSVVSTGVHNNGSQNLIRQINLVCENISLYGDWSFEFSKYFKSLMKETRI